MYMNTRANLGYWSTETCCIKWSLRTGTLIIGFLTMICYGLLVGVGVMAVISCPVVSNTTDTEVTEVAEKIISKRETIEVEEKPAKVECEGVEVVNITNLTVVICPFVPRPEMESLGVTDANTFLFVVSVFITYSSVYFILSLCIVIGAFKRTARLLSGWVALSRLHMVLIIADLLFTLAFTTLVHMCTSLALFVVVLYTWAVVKSYMLTLRAEKNLPPIAEDKDTNDYTVDGIYMEDIPVTV